MNIHIHTYSLNVHAKLHEYVLVFPPCLHMQSHLYAHTCSLHVCMQCSISIHMKGCTRKHKTPSSPHTPLFLAVPGGYPDQLQPAVPKDAVPGPQPVLLHGWGVRDHHHGHQHVQQWKSRADYSHLWELHHHWNPLLHWRGHLLPLNFGGRLLLYQQGGTVGSNPLFPPSFLLVPLHCSDGVGEWGFLCLCGDMDCDTRDRLGSSSWAWSHPAPCESSASLGPLVRGSDSRLRGIVDSVMASWEK